MSYSYRPAIGTFIVDSQLRAVVD